MSLVDELLSMIASRRCAACDTALSGLCDAVFCEGCLYLLVPVSANLMSPHPSSSVFRYQGPLADAVRRMKYGGRSDLAPRLARLMFEAAERFLPQVEAIIPIPIRPQRLKERHFNQSLLLARPLARRLSLPLRTSMLSCARGGPPQTSLDASERAGNVEQAFTASYRGKPCSVLLVDDVRTTGATLAAATAALRGCDVRACSLTLAATEA